MLKRYWDPKGPHIPEPTLTFVSPSSIPTNFATTVLFYGTGFTTDSVAYISDTALATTYLGETSLRGATTASTFLLPKSTTAYVNTLDNRTTALPFTIVQGSTVAPTLTSLDPYQALIGSPDLILKVNGSGFVQSSVIVFNGGDEHTTYISPYQVSTIVKPSTASGAWTVPVAVRNGPAMSNPLNFSFTYTTLAVASLTPPEAVIGGPDFSLIVHGTGFDTSTVIVFNGGDEPTALVSPTMVTTVVKPSTASGEWTIPVNVRNGTLSSNSMPFSFIHPTPSIVSVSPSVAVRGSSDVAVTILGNNFMPISVAKLNGNPIPTTYSSLTKITAVVPSSTVTAPAVLPVTVSNGKSGSNALDFTFV